MIVLDASVLIAHLDADDAHHHRARELIASTLDEDLGSHQLTLAEVLVGPAAGGRLHEVIGALDQLGVTSIPMAADAHLRLAILRAATRLRLPDCCVLLAAEQTSGTVATFDERLARQAAQQGLRVLTHD